MTVSGDRLDDSAFLYITKFERYIYKIYEGNHIKNRKLLLNKRNELVFKCGHRGKFKLS